MVTTVESELREHGVRSLEAALLCEGFHLLGTRLGAGEALACGEAGVLVGMLGGRVARPPYAAMIGRPKPLDPALFALARTLEL